MWFQEWLVYNLEHLLSRMTLKEILGGRFYIYGDYVSGECSCVPESRRERRWLMRGYFP